MLFKMEDHCSHPQRHVFKMEGEGTAAVAFGSCAMFAILPKVAGSFTCSNCMLIALLEDEVQQLEERVATLQRIRELELFLEATENTVSTKEETGDTPEKEASSPTQVPDIWRNVTQRSRRPRVHSDCLEIHNRFEVLSPSMEDEEQTPFEDLSLITVDQVYEDEQQSQSSGNVQATLERTAHGRTPTKPKRRCVVVIGDSLLRGTEAVICGPDKMSREVCCLPGAKIQDVTERLQGIIKPTDKYPFLLVHVGTNDTASNSLQKIKREYEALGRKLKQLNAQIVISSVLPVERRGPGREGKIVEVNSWLRKWCKQERFGFLDHGLQFLEDGLLASNGLHLTAVGRNVFAKNLRNLIRKALN
uniref:SGNH hydrolase-type esterase domain-containing protein n=1 Tax=Podarcis muralis TaxID=64176 RepID=A0A670JHM6_PODMU